MAKSSSADRRCCNCSTNCDEKSGKHPVSVTPYDQPDGRPELWCPRCFVWVRMHREPERWNASHAVAVKCHSCGGEGVAMTYSGGGVRCGHCNQPYALPIRPTKEDLDVAFAAVRDAAEDAKILKDVRK